MTDTEILFYVFIVVTAIGSYWWGHKTGTNNTLSFLHNEGIIEFEEEGEEQ